MDEASQEKLYKKSFFSGLPVEGKESKILSPKLKLMLRSKVDALHSHVEIKKPTGKVK